MNLCAQDGLPSEGPCLRCGRFVCARCRRWQAEQALCADCRGRLGTRASPQARLSLLLATLGLGLLLPAVPAVVLAHGELGRIRRCESSDAGEDTARLARSLGIAELLLGSVVGLILYLRFAG